MRLSRVLDRRPARPKRCHAGSQDRVGRLFGAVDASDWFSDKCFQTSVVVRTHSLRVAVLEREPARHHEPRGD